jgi:hypothetical protein
VTGYVYFIEAMGLDRIKIGFTTDAPMARRSQLQGACPVELDLLGFSPGGAERDARRYETKLHETFGPFRVRGEWFEAVPIMRGFIADALVPWPFTPSGDFRDSAAELHYRHAWELGRLKRRRVPDDPFIEATGLDSSLAARLLNLGQFMAGRGRFFLPMHARELARGWGAPAKV